VFSDIYKGKKILVSGNTGFKGAWLTCWLLKLGAEVVGISKDIPSEPSMFNALNLSSSIKHYENDIRDYDSLLTIVMNEKPDMIFHLAAQAIVSESYINPVETITSNVIGTMNILEVARKIDWPTVCVLITSDKTYDNLEWEWGYKETDMLGGKDIYSGSKGSADIIIKSYFNSFFNEKNSHIKLGVGRAGNVIGGGDWAKDRIIVDTVKAWSKKETVKIRCPKATRPWQHVLEPLSGYLTLGHNLLNSDDNNGEAFNFGPRSEQNRTVVELLGSMSEYWTADLPKEPYKITENLPFKEAGLLKLNCDKALFYLKWDATLDYFKTVKMTSDWYSNFYSESSNMLEFTNRQIDEYEKIATERGSIWTNQKTK